MMPLIQSAMSVLSCSTPLSQGWTNRVTRSGRSTGFFFRQMSTKSRISVVNTRLGRRGGGWVTMYSSSSNIATGTCGILLKAEKQIK